MNNSGMGYYQKGNYAMARREFQRAVIDDPRAPDYRHNLAMAMQKTGDAAGAEQVLRHNLTVDPMHQPTYHALAQLLVSQQRQGEAEQLLAGWRDTQPYVPETYVELAWLQREEGNRVAAEQSLRQALQVKQNHPTALAHLGQLYQDSGQNDQAAAYYQQSLVTRWNQPQVHSRLATITGSTSTLVNMRRSAMLNNDAYVQPAFAEATPMTIQSASFTPMDPATIGSPEIAMLDGGGRPQRRRRMRSDQLTAYPLPDFGNAGSVGNTGLVYGQPNFVVSSPSTDGPFVASQPDLAPQAVTTAKLPGSQADPAHATEDNLAGLPVLEPY